MKYTAFGTIAAAAIGLSTFVVQPTTAAEMVKMVAIDGYPARSMWVQEFSNFFIPRVNEELAKTGNYQVEWQEAYGGQIVKPRGVLEGIKLGLGDIGIVTTIFHNSVLPSQGISAVTPFISSDARVVAKAVDEIAKEYPAMAAELDEENQVYLATGVVLDTYQLFSKEPIDALDDLQGRKWPAPAITCAISKESRARPVSVAVCRTSTICSRQVSSTLRCFGRRRRVPSRSPRSHLTC